MKILTCDTKTFECSWYKAWEKFILIWAVYSSFFTPMEFGFFRGLPKNLYFLDIAGQIAFLIDVVLHFFIAYRDTQTYKMISNRNLIAVRFVISSLHIQINKPVYNFFFE